MKGNPFLNSDDQKFNFGPVFFGSPDRIFRIYYISNSASILENLQGKPKVSNLFRTKLRCIVSKALERSIKITPIRFPSSICFFQISIIFRREYWELWFFLKPQIKGEHFDVMKLGILWAKLHVAFISAFFLKKTRSIEKAVKLSLKKCCFYWQHPF